MKLINKLNKYLADDDYQIVIKNNLINIINIEEIVDFSIDKVTIRCNQKIISIDGKNLIISKMQEDEVLISGIILGISIN